MTGAYTFRCPQCGGVWLLEQFVKVAGDVFASFEGVGACPLCDVKFSWTKSGELKPPSEWWKTAFAGKKKYLPPHKCDFFKCNNWIEGSDKRLYRSEEHTSELQSPT